MKKNRFTCLELIIIFIMIVIGLSLSALAWFLFNYISGTLGVALWL